MNMNGKTIGGIALLVVGLFLLLNQGEGYGPGELIGLFWPSIFVLPLSLFFHWMYFAVTGRKGVGLLVPGGVLAIVAIVCQIGMLFNNWGYIWPGFLLAPAFGLFELYWFGNRNRFLLIPIAVLSVLFVLFFTLFSLGFLFDKFASGQLVIAILVILAGALLILPKKKH